MTKKSDYVRAYKINHTINFGKIEEVRLTTIEYRKTAKEIAKNQWKLFFTESKFNKFANLENINFNNTSEKYARYKQTIQYQVVGQLKSFVSNRANDFKSYVHNSSLETITKRQLFRINKNQLWFCRELNPAIAKLARSIFKECLKHHRKPNFSRCNLVLDSKICQILDKNDTKATSFHNWLQFSTLDLGKPIFLPLKANKFFEKAAGTRNNSVQLNWKDGKLEVYLTRKLPRAKLLDGSKKLGLDLGLRTLFASNLGDLVGRRFIDRLSYFDTIITQLFKNLQELKIKPRTNERYNKLIRRCKESLKNEVRRCINRLVEIHQPDELVVEKLNFKSPNLSKKMNRLLSKFGKQEIAKKLVSVEEELGIRITYVNPAYSSQECPKCHYVARNNRNKEAFHCKMCGFKCHADVVGGKNLVPRSSWDEPLYRSKSSILSFLKDLFLENSERFSLKHLEKVLSKNPYFKDVKVTTPGSGLVADNYRPKGFCRSLL